MARTQSQAFRGGSVSGGSGIAAGDIKKLILSYYNEDGITPNQKTYDPVADSDTVIPISKLRIEDYTGGLLATYNPLYDDVTIRLPSDGLVRADSADTDPKTLTEKLEIVDNVRDPDDPDDTPLLHLEVTVDGQGNRRVAINEDNLHDAIDELGNTLDRVIDTIDELDMDSIPHAYLHSTLNQSAGDSVTTSTSINVFAQDALEGDCFEFEQTTTIDDTPFGYVWIKPGTYLINASVTLQWVGDPRGTFIAKVGSVMGENFDFSQEQEVKRNTTRVVTIPDRMKLSVNITYDAGTPVMGFWIQSMQVVKLAGGMSQTNITHDDTLTGKGSVAEPLGVNNQVVAQSTLAGNVAPEFDPTKPNDEGGYAYYAGTNVTHDGKNYVFVENHSRGGWNPAEVEQKPLSESIQIEGVGEAVKEWLDEHPEATTTVENNSITNDKLHSSIKVNRNASADNMGYLVLAKASEFASQVTEGSTIYEIRDNFDLGGETVEIPENCVLKFNGGTIDNGTLVGNGTRLEYDKICFGEDIDFSGTWYVPVIRSSMLENCTSSNNLKKLVKLCNQYVINDLYIDDGEYIFTPSVNNEAFIAPPSNTKIHNGGVLKITPNGFKNYQLVIFDNVENCLFEGGEVVGDADDHDYSSGGSHEWGHGIDITETSKNIVIQDVYSHDMTGDGITISGKNHKVSNVKITHCGRNGIAIIDYVECLSIENFYIDDIYRTSPRFAIDIEPNWQYKGAKSIQIKNGIVKNCSKIIGITRSENVIVDGIYAHNCKSGVSVGASGREEDSVKDVTVRNVYLDSVDYSPYAYFVSAGTRARNIIFDNCCVDGDMSDVSSWYCVFIDNDVPNEIVVKNSRFCANKAGFVFNGKMENCLFKTKGNDWSSRYGTKSNLDNITEFENCEFHGFGYIYCGTFIFKGCQFITDSSYSESFVVNGISGTNIKQYRFENCYIDNKSSTISNYFRFMGDVVVNGLKIITTELINKLFRQMTGNLVISVNNLDFLYEFVGSLFDNVSASNIVNYEGADFSKINHLKGTIKITDSNKTHVFAQSAINVVEGIVDLNGKSVTLPSDKTLIINGSIMNGTLNINGNKILPNYNVLDGVTVAGNPGAGTIKYESSKYVVWNGSAWVNMDGSV
jgi:hypothetical protein